MRAGRGRMADLSGRMAEEAVLRLYLQRGAQVLATRWRGQGAEIDLIVQDGPRPGLYRGQGVAQPC